MADRPPRPNPRPLSTAKPAALPTNASEREVALWCANLAAQCAHNWNVAQSWFEMFSAQQKDVIERVERIEQRFPIDEIPVHVASRDLHEMRERAASIHDIEEVMERVVEKSEGRNVNSERVREITETVVTRKGYDELSQAQRDRRAFYLSVFLVVLAAALGILGGRVSAPHESAPHDLTGHAPDSHS